MFLSNELGVSDIAQLNPENGGILYFEGVNMLINRSCFIGSTGFKGGAIYVTSYALEINQNVGKSKKKIFFFFFNSFENAK